MARELDMAIIGGGVAGAYCGWRLTHPEARAGGVGLFEYSDRIGGRLYTKHLPGMPHVPAELGGMRYIPAEQPLVSNLIDALGLRTQDFLMGNPDPGPDGKPIGDSENIMYLRGRHLRVKDMSDPTKVPYALNWGERGKTVNDLQVYAMNLLVPDNQSLTLAGWMEARAFGQPLYTFGFWNLMARTLSAEAYAFMKDAGGYDANVANANAVTNLPATEYSAETGYKCISRGYQALPETLYEQFTRAGGQGFKNHRLARIRREQGLYQLEFRKTVTGPVQTEYGTKFETRDDPSHPEPLVFHLAKSVLSEEHPGFVGTYTGCSSDYTTYTAVDEADLLLVAGDLITDDYTSAVQKANASMVVAYDNAVRIGSSTYADVPLGRFLEELSKACEGRQASGGEPWVSRSERGAAAPAGGKEDPLTYERFFSRMGTWVDEGMTLLPDESASMYVSCNLHVKRENGFVSQAAWGSIGYAAPAGLGLAVADPRHRPVVFIGDGGFQMTAQTLGGMAFYRLNPVVFVMDNGIYGIEQALTSSEVYTGKDRLEPFDAYNVLARWDYARLAEALGVQGRKVATVGELDAVLEEVKATPRSPFLVQVRIPERNMPAEIIRLATNEAPSAP